MSSIVSLFVPVEKPVSYVFKGVMTLAGGMFMGFEW